MSPNDVLLRLAKAMAAAYWRGRLESFQHRGFEDSIFEAMIAVAAENDWERWKSSAKYFLEIQ